MNHRELAERYFSHVKQRDLDALCALYGASAELALPDGRQLNGIQTIREMYHELFAAQSPAPTPLAFVIGDKTMAVELEIRLPNGETRKTANFFALDANGLIERLTIYARKST